MIFFQVLFNYTTVGDILDDISEVQFSSGDDQETTWYLPEDQGLSLYAKASG